MPTELRVAYPSHLFGFIKKFPSRVRREGNFLCLILLIDISSMSYFQYYITICCFLKQQPIISYSQTMCDNRRIFHTFYVWRDRSIFNCLELDTIRSCVEGVSLRN